jgi:hypothetical protein
MCISIKSMTFFLKLIIRCNFTGQEQSLGFRIPIQPYSLRFGNSSRLGQDHHYQGMIY